MVCRHNRSVETLRRELSQVSEALQHVSGALRAAERRLAAQALLEELGSPLVCKDLHYDGTGNLCEAAGTSTFEDLYGFPRTPLHLRSPSEKFGWEVGDESIDQPR